MAADTAPAAYEIELIGMNGTVITTIPFSWLIPLDITVQHLASAMERGAVPRVPPAHRDNNDMYMERFLLVMGHCRMATYERIDMCESTGV